MTKGAPTLILCVGVAAVFVGSARIDRETCDRDDETCRNSIDSAPLKGASQLQWNAQLTDHSSDSGTSCPCDVELRRLLQKRASKATLLEDANASRQECIRFCKDSGCACKVPWSVRCQLGSCAGCAECTGEPTPSPTNSLAKNARQASDLPTPTPEPTPEDTAPPLPPREAQEPGICTFFGDPHITTFDGSKVNFYGYGDYWIVKSSDAWVQARYWSHRQGGNAMTYALAIGGPFLRTNGQDNTLIIEPTRGGIWWNRQEILKTLPSKFHINELIVAEYQEDVAQNGKRAGQKAERVFVLLPGMDLRITRWGKNLNTILLMDAISGQDGHCGNFNGNPNDDTTALVKARMGQQVIGMELLFPVKNNTYVGCFAEDANDRDLPVQRSQQGASLQECSRLCSGYKYFGRQGNQECWCGNSAPKHSQLPEQNCNCGDANAANMGPGNCVYTYYDAQQPPDSGISDCPPAVAQAAEQRCRQSLPDSPSSAALEACIIDVCFAGDEFANQDGDEVEQESETTNEFSGYPNCVKNNVKFVPSGSAVAIRADLTPYGASAGCVNNDCTQTDRFNAASDAACAAACYAVAFCRKWTFSSGVCSLIAGNGQRQQEPGAKSGSRRCHPAGFCDDRPSAQMVERGDACKGYQKIAEGTRCNTNKWIRNKYCRYQCFLAGFAYDGENCNSFQR